MFLISYSFLNLLSKFTFLFMATDSPVSSSVTWILLCFPSDLGNLVCFLDNAFLILCEFRGWNLAVNYTQMYVPWKHPCGEQMKSRVVCIIGMSRATSNIRVPQIPRNGRAFSGSGSEKRESLPLFQEQMLGMISHQPKPVSAEAPNHSFPGWLQPGIAHLQKPLEISKPSSPSFSSIQQVCLLTQPCVMNKLSVCAAGASP